MKKSSKAVLTTAFVLPGLGHYALKRYISAVILMGTSLILSYVLISTSVDRTLLIADKIMTGEIDPDLLEIVRIASESLTGDGSSYIGYVTTALAIVWAVAVLDIIRVSRQQ